MATDLTQDLNKISLPIPLDSGLHASGNVRIDRSQDRRFTSTKESEDHDSVFDIFKKIQRAERFGIPVHLSEAEKRYSRAERFGIDSARGLDEMVKAEKLKRKTRTERFELLNSSVVTAEEAKKKARLDRFASFS